MKWKKVGLIFQPASQHPWMQTHASNPLLFHLQADLYRIFFATRDAYNRSSIAFIDFRLDTLEVVNVTEEPVLLPGPLGFFDDHGVYAASLVKKENKVFLYYTGWNPGLRPQFYTSIGLAFSEDGGNTFSKYSTAPILSRNEIDPWMVSQPFVLCEENIWRMWYISGIAWKEEDQVLHSYYHLKYAESIDGISWQRNGIVALDLQAGEKNIARPCIIKEQGKYKMWLSFNRGEGYRLGYAESTDGMVWTRKDDEAGMAPSLMGWDSHATAYPWVINYKNKKYLFYNGNSFGKDGIGLAIED